MGDVWESDGVVVETWESSTEPGVTFTTVIREGDIVTGGSGGDLSDATPQDLGTAAAGVSDEASRADHVHDMPTAADIAVDASGFNGNLTTSDDTVQEIAQKLDDLGGGGVTVHNLLTGRDAEDAHPIGAITGLQDALDNGGASALADLTDVDVTSDPPAQDDVLAWDDTENKWTPATLDGGVALSDATPQDLGTAAAGTSEDAARADHVHDMPNAADIAVDASGFNGNLTTSDDTVQGIAQKLDDLSVSTGTGGFTRSLMLGGM